MSLEKEDPALVVFTSPMGEKAARVHLFTKTHGLLRGVTYGVSHPSNRVLWQLGNLVKTRIRQRREGGVPIFSGEVLETYAICLFDLPLALDLVQSICALINTTLLEHEACPFLFDQTVYVLTTLCDLGKRRVPKGEASIGFLNDQGVSLYLRWELLLLETLGFGLDFSGCAVTGKQEELAYVSPRTGRAVSKSGAGIWRDRLLPLPAFLLTEAEKGDPLLWLEGFRLTGYFLQRHVYDQYHRPIPVIRHRLIERIKALVR